MGRSELNSRCFLACAKRLTGDMRSVKDPKTVGTIKGFNRKYNVLCSVLNKSLRIDPENHR